MATNDCFECKWLLKKGSLFACKNKKYMLQNKVNGKDYIDFASNSVRGPCPLEKDCEYFEKKS